MLSDWTDEDPERVYAKLKKLSHYVTTHPRDINRCPAGTLCAQQRRAVGEVCLTA
jgi:hypothetical protein